MPRKDRGRRRAEPPPPAPGRGRWRARLILLALVAAGVALLHVALWRPREVSSRGPEDGYFRVGGVVHVHTTLSDGGGTPEEVVAAATRAGLAFVAITDHNNLDAKPSEGYHGPVLVLVGSEISTSAGHVLALGIDDPVFRFSGNARDGLDDVRELGGIAFAAHPLSPREDFRWTGWDLPGDWGMELLNGDSEWRKASWGQLLRTGGLYLVNHRYALLSGLVPPTDALARWDRLTATRDATGIVGADAHRRMPLTRRFALPFPSYEAVFSLAQNHVLLRRPLTGDAKTDGAAILDALRHGHSYVGLDALAPANGFSFLAEAGGRRWIMGETAPAESGLSMRADGAVPAGTQLTLLRDGVRLRESAPPLVMLVPGPGVYRVEARAPGMEVPWVITNPIYVFDDAEREARAARAAWPVAAPAPLAASAIDDFEGETTFAPEFDPSSLVATPVIAPGAGTSGSRAGRLAFRLGTPTAAQPYTWCALVSRMARDLTGRSGLVFAVRADGVYRFWVQVRDLNPASADEGTEWWFASVRTTPEWRRVAVPFSELRSLNRASDHHLDLDKVRQLVFVLDHASVKAGTQGTIWFDDIGVY